MLNESEKTKPSKLKYTHASSICKAKVPWFDLNIECVHRAQFHIASEHSDMPYTHSMDQPLGKGQNESNNLSFLTLFHILLLLLQSCQKLETPSKVESLLWLVSRYLPAQQAHAGKHYHVIDAETQFYLISTSLQFHVWRNEQNQWLFIEMSIRTHSIQ